MLRFKVLPAIFCLLFSTILNAQMPGMGGSGGGAKFYDGKISGQVLDGLSGAPVEFANIALFERGSTKPVDGTITDVKGNFRLKNIRNGRYKISVSFLGYNTMDIDSVVIAEGKTAVDLGKINLESKAHLLNEAQVDGEKQLIETRIDKLVYNAEKDITVKGGNATDVLRKVPMVQVDLDGNVMLQGTQNVKVLINNKPSSLTAGSVAEAMKMIPADEIEKVEVITSPGAKYDAEGTGGIINIITKKKNIQGWSGMINAGAGTKSSNLFGNASYRQGRFGSALSFGAWGYTGTGELTTTRTTPYSILRQDGDNKNSGFGPYTLLSLDYDFNSKTNLAGSLRMSNWGNRSNGITDNYFSYNNSAFFKLYANDYYSKTDGLNLDGSIDFKRSFKKKEQELSVSAQLTDSERDTEYEIERLDSLGRTYYKENSLNTSNNREFTLQADYSHPFSKSFSVDAGAKAIRRMVKSDYDYRIYDFPSDAFMKDAARSNVFDYDQDILAAYTQASLMIKKFGIRSGLRYEKTDVGGSFSNSLKSISSNYENLIPNLTLSYTRPSKFTLKLSYTQRIQRPGLTFLNPYINQSDSINISYGNPDLTAEKSHAFEAGWNLFRKFGSINTSVYHRFTNNAIESIRFIDTSDVYVTTYDNIGKNYSTGLSLGLNVMWKMKLFMGSNFNIYYYKVKSSGLSTDLSNDGINYNISLYGSYKFSKRWGVQAFGNWNGPRYSVQGKSTSFFYYNMSARREFKNEKGGIGLGLDNFATWYMNFRNEYSGPGFDYNNNNRVLFLGVRLSFDYRFGKMEFNQQRRKKGVKNDDLKEDGQGGMMNQGGQ